MRRTGIELRPFSHSVRIVRLPHKTGRCCLLQMGNFPSEILPGLGTLCCANPCYCHWVSCTKIRRAQPCAAGCGCNFHHLGKATAILVLIPAAHTWTELVSPIFPFPPDPDLSMVSFLLSRIAWRNSYVSRSKRLKCPGYPGKDSSEAILSFWFCLIYFFSFKSKSLWG